MLHRLTARGANKTRKSIESKAVDEAARVEEIARRLHAEHGSPRHHNPEDPLDDLIFLVLSRMTQEVKYLRTYERLRRELPSWDGVREAAPDVLEAILQDAGLARVKTHHIQAILDEIQRREGALDLSRLRTLSDEDVEAYLTRIIHGFRSKKPPSASEIC